MIRVRTMNTILGTALTAVLSIPLVIGPASSAAEPARKAASTDLRVMSYNIHHGHPWDSDIYDDPPDLNRTARNIERINPDIVMIQEVNKNHPAGDGVDQPAKLARLLGMHVVFGDNHPDEDKKAGNAVLSRFPVEEVANTPLPSRPGGARRHLQSVRVDVNGTPALVYNTHLEPDPEWRQKQARKVLDEIGRIDGPTLLTGDFNAKPSGDIHGWVENHGFVDAWQERPKGDGFTWRADKPSKRIDYVFASSDFDIVDVGVHDTVASDHRPVRIDLRLP
ncbi:MAG: hypothetical protein GEU98_11180 [Pseudonocardiaceae bacterium]|nr:hypothetical protein [Pseudonocardiaceae bacterium]